MQERDAARIPYHQDTQVKGKISGRKADRSSMESMNGPFPRPEAASGARPMTLNNRSSDRQETERQPGLGNPQRKPK